MARKYVDCREYKSDINCSLRISGTEDEVLDAAEMHSVSKHHISVGPDFRENLRASLKDEV